MRPMERQTFEDEIVFEHSDMSDITAAFHCGLKNITFLGIWTRGSNLAFMRGRAAREGRPIIDLPDSSALTTAFTAEA